MKKRLRFILALVMILMLVASVPVTAADDMPVMGEELTAANTASVKTLEDGMTYFVKEDLTINGSKTNKNGLVVANGATVTLNIPAGVTLTVYGKNGSGTTGGGAAILLPNGATLRVVGSGKLVAVGGNAGNGAKGGDGGRSIANDNVDGHYKSEFGSNTVYFAGAGGTGGYGGGGAGAGIGTDGARGGSGGGIGGAGWRDDNIRDYSRNGSNGSTGTSGSSSAEAGNFICASTIDFAGVKGGNAGSAGYGGSAGSNGYDGDNGDARGIAGGAGGGGGGGGLAGAAIGTGGGGGGQGGGGGSAGYIWSGYYVGGSGGGGGQGAGTSGGGIKGSSDVIPEYDCDNTRTGAVVINRISSNGGNGNVNSYGSNGRGAYMKITSNNNVSSYGSGGDGGRGGSSGAAAVAYTVGNDSGKFGQIAGDGLATVTFDANGGEGTMEAVNDISGRYILPSNGFTAPSGKEFKGWATSDAGSVITEAYITVFENITLYAVWENIPAAAPEATVDNLTLTYGEFEDQKLTVNVDKEADHTYTYNWTDANGNTVSETDTLAVADNTAVGVYTYDCEVTATRTDNNETATTTVKGIKVEVKSKNLNDQSANVTLKETKFIYNGQEQKPTVAVTYEGKPLTEGTDYTISWPDDCTNVGTKAVTINFTGNYSGSVEKTFEITKAPLTVKANDKTITYGDDAANDGVTYTGFVANETESVLGGALAYSYSYNKFDNVGTYDITVSGLTSDNYDITFEEGTLTVAQKEIGISWGTTSFIYSGEPQAPTASATGTVNGDQLTLTVEGEETNASDAAYTATVTAISGEKAPNYKLPKDASVSFNIAKADQKAPVVTKEDETLSEKADGKITDVTDKMEYRAEGESEYTAITGTVVENLADGKYFVRYAEDSNHNASPDAEVSIEAGRKLVVTYKADGNVVGTAEVDYGKDATAPALPEKEGFVVKWDKESVNITADTEINAVYTEVVDVDLNDVKPEDKAELEKIKKQLEEMLKDEGYSPEDKKKLQAALDEINQALAKVEKMEADAAAATGDNSNIWLWVQLLVVSGMAACGAVLFGRKRRAAGER